VGLAIAAPLASLLGISHTILIFAAVTFVVILVLLATPAVWKMELEPNQIGLSENS